MLIDFQLHHILKQLELRIDVGVNAFEGECDLFDVYCTTLGSKVFLRFCFLALHSSTFILTLTNGSLFTKQ